jgi:hypothetical protein
VDRDFAALLEPPFDRVYLSCDAEDADDRLSNRLPRKEKEQGYDANHTSGSFSMAADEFVDFVVSARKEDAVS